MATEASESPFVKQMMKNKGMAIVQDLPEEVLMEILSRIPAKSLLRFKSVSKYWYSLIQNPSFISLHHTRAKPYYCISLIRTVDNHPFQCSLYLDPKEETLFEDLDLSFATPHSDETFSLRGSCNGLLICASFRSTIMICNPATREFRVLPQPPYHTLYTTYVGFAFDTKTNDYKVLRFSTFFGMDIYHKIQIYSMSSDSWKEIVATVPHHNTFPLHHPSILLDGFFYWLSYNHSTSVCVIYTLNMVEGLFLRRSLPIGVGSDSCPILCLLNDSLALVAPKYDRELGETCFDVWLMDEYGVECWTKKCTIGPLLGNQRAFAFWPNNEVLLTGCVNGLLVLFNHSTRDIKEYQQICNLPGRTCSMQVFPHSESLVSVKRRVNLA